MRAAGMMAPLWQAIALFAGGWLVAQVLGHAGFPGLRLGYARGRRRARTARHRSALAVGVALAAAGGTAYAQRPPVVHLAAGVHAGPIVITHREVLVGDAGRGRPRRHHRRGQRRDDQERLRRRRRERDHGRRRRADDARQRLGVRCEARRHPRSPAPASMIKNCTSTCLATRSGRGSTSRTHGHGDEHGRRLQRGRRDGGNHHALVDDRDRQRPGRAAPGDGISMTEMSMGTIVRQRGQRRSRRRHLLQRPLDVHDRAQHRRRHAGRQCSAATPPAAGFGVLASFQSEADLRGNELAANPVPMGSVTNSELRTTH